MENYEYDILGHLHSRYLNTLLHRVWIVPEIAIFPLYNLSGQIVALQHYRPNAPKEVRNVYENRYFTRRHNKEVAVWGLESWRLSNTLFICEGVFDAAKITWLGFSAIATLSNDIDSSTASWLKLVGKARDTVAVCDSDVAGRKLAKHANRSIQLADYHDIGDTPIDIVQELCSKLNLY